MAKYHKKTMKENKPGHTDPLKVCTSVIFYFSVNSLSVFRSQNYEQGHHLLEPASFTHEPCPTCFCGEKLQVQY